MYRVFIPSGPFYIERQISQTLNNTIGNCEFVFNNEEDYDFFVTIDGISQEIECKVDKDYRLLFLGEPPYVKQYNDRFINQYGHVFSCQKRKIEIGQAKRSFPLLPWMLGMSFQENSHKTKEDAPFMTYDDFKSLKDDGQRLNKCCLITSNKKFTKGHRDRVRFANYVIEHCSDIIDVYGNGYNPIPDKFDVLRKYKYAIVIENCRYDDYWTEKIGDSYLAGCYPIYHGCLNIDEYFPQGAFSLIDVCRIEESIESIKRIMAMDISEKSKAVLQRAKELVLDEYNIFPQIAKTIEEIEIAKGITINNGEYDVLHPMKLSVLDIIKQKIAWKLNIIF